MSDTVMHAWDVYYRRTDKNGKTHVGSTRVYDDCWVASQKAEAVKAARAKGSKLIKFETITKEEYLASK